MVPIRHYTTLSASQTKDSFIAKTQKIIQFTEIINKQNIIWNNKSNMGETAVEQVVKIDDSTEQTEKVDS